MSRSDPIPTLDEILDEVWAALDDAVRHARDPFHTPTVATVHDGIPSARTVVLRRADRARGTLGFNTDVRSPKVARLRDAPAVAWHFYDRDRRMQLRIDSVATLHTGDARAEDAWAAVSPLGRRCYGQSLGPGAPAEDPLVGLPDLAALEAADPTVVAACRENFCAVSCRVRSIDWLTLRFHGHRRARFEAADGADAGWTGRWVAP